MSYEAAALHLRLLCIMTAGWENHKQPLKTRYLWSQDKRGGGAECAGGCACVDWGLAQEKNEAAETSVCKEEVGDEKVWSGRCGRGN